MGIRWRDETTIAATAGTLVGFLGAIAILKPRVVAPSVTDVAFAGPVIPGLQFEQVPDVAVVLAVVGLSVALVAGSIWAIARGVALFVTRGGPVMRAYRYVRPESPLGRMATGIIGLLVVMILVTGVLLGSIGELGASQGGAVSGASDLAGDQLAGVFSNDVASMPSATDDERSDVDGDGLPDAWERRGETPSGVQLPDADPQRKDLYVQLAFESEGQALSAARKAPLREIWATMPVENPDGSTGISLHLRTTDSVVGQSMQIPGNGTDHRTFYSNERMGDRRCTYRLAVIGGIDRDRLAVRADAPGYVAFVDSADRAGYTGSSSFRLAAITHGLLHTITGEIDGTYHPGTGWLTTGSPDEHLSPATAAKLNETGFRQPADYPGC